jgi:hypothetical protein
MYTSGCLEHELTEYGQAEILYLCRLRKTRSPMIGVIPWSVNGCGPCRAKRRAALGGCVHMPRRSWVVQPLRHASPKPWALAESKLFAVVILDFKWPTPLHGGAGVCMEAHAKPYPVFDNLMQVHIDPNPKQRHCAWAFSHSSVP